jgi:hypothetical protein
LEPAAISIRRPGTGLPSSQMMSVLGRKVRCAIPAGTVLGLDMLEPQ